MEIALITHITQTDMDMLYLLLLVEFMAMRCRIRSQLAVVDRSRFAALANPWIRVRFEGRDGDVALPPKISGCG